MLFIGISLWTNSTTQRNLTETNAIASKQFSNKLEFCVFLIVLEMHYGILFYASRIFGYDCYAFDLTLKYWLFNKIEIGQ